MIPYKIQRIVSMLIATKIDELTVPLINSYVPRHAQPKNVMPIDRQMNCRVFDAGKFRDENINTASPSINIDARGAKTCVAIDGSKPNPSTKLLEKKNACENK